MSDGEQALLNYFVRLVKANRWVQIGHTLLAVGHPRVTYGFARCRARGNYAQRPWPPLEFLS
jgi:hypothetical protein